MLVLGKATTKKALTDKVQQIMYGNDINKSFKENYPEHFSFMKELFKQHEKADEKMEGLIDIEIHKNKKFNSVGFVIIKEGKEPTTISYKECITHTKNKQEYDFTIALRVAITEDTENYYNSAIKKCVFCGSNKFLEVDHIKQFKFLKQQFIEDNNINICDYTFKKARCNRPCFSEENRQIESEWRDFHNSFSDNLRILCRSCNGDRNIGQGRSSPKQHYVL